MAHVICDVAMWYLWEPIYLLSNARRYFDSNCWLRMQHNYDLVHANDSSTNANLSHSSKRIYMYLISILCLLIRPSNI